MRMKIRKDRLFPSAKRLLSREHTKAIDQCSSLRVICHSRSGSGRHFSSIAIFAQSFHLVPGVAAAITTITTATITATKVVAAGEPEAIVSDTRIAALTMQAVQDRTHGSHGEVDTQTGTSAESQQREWNEVEERCKLPESQARRPCELSQCDPAEMLRTPACQALLRSYLYSKVFDIIKCLCEISHEPPCSHVTISIYIVY